jgi:DNA-binding XRE family transcriptional regulator
MNTLLQARQHLKLTPGEFALLLGVTESVIILEEEKVSAQKMSLAQSLGILILANPSKSVRVLIENRIATESDQDKRHQLSELLRKLSSVA